MNGDNTKMLNLRNRGRSRTLRRVVGALAVITTALSLATVPVLAASGDPIFAADTQLNTPATIGGGGSTFAAPLENAAIATYLARVPNATIDAYQAIGSGAGITDIIKKIVNWAGSDVPMTSADIAKNAGTMPLAAFLQAPIGLGGVGIVYNLPGLSSKIHLHLTASIIAKIYLGKITSWNNSAIKALNKGVKLPSSKIVVVARADSSGTTYIFTDFMHTAASGVWTTSPSKTELKLPPGGLAGPGNAGVATDVEHTANSFGYVEYSYILLNAQLRAGVAAVENRYGSFLVPTIAAIAADAARKPKVSSTSFSIVYEGGKDSYPICGYTWAIVYKKQTNKATGTLLVKYLDWLAHTGTASDIGGQVIAGQQGYVPLPANIQALARTTLLKVTGTTGQVLLTSHG